MSKRASTKPRSTSFTRVRHALSGAVASLVIVGGVLVATPLRALSSTAISQTTIVSGLAIPFGLAVDSAGNYYVGDVGDNAIYKVTPSGAETTVATPFGGSYALAVDASGDLFYDNNSDDGIYEVSPNGSQTFVAAGPPDVFGLAVDSSGDLFASSYLNSTVIEIAANGGAETTVGSFSGAWGLAEDAQNNLYVADYNDGTVWKVTPGGVRSVFVNGLATSTPLYLTVDSSGNVYIGESFNGVILEVTPGGSVSTFDPAFDYPASMVIDAHGHLVADSATDNDVVEFLTNVDAPTNLLVSEGTNSESATWTGDGTATTYTCTLMYGFNDPTTYSVTTPSSTCTFNGLATTKYGIRVVANNGTASSSPVVGFATTPTTTTTTTTIKPRPPIRTITCVRKKSVRHVRGVNPHCPAGFKLR